MACLLLPVALQGTGGFIRHGVPYAILWCGFLSAWWLFWRWPLWPCLPAILLSFAYSGYLVSQRDDVGYNEVSAMLDSDPAEAIAYVSQPWALACIGVIVLVFAGLCWLLGGRWLQRRLPLEVRLHVAVLPLLMAWCVGHYALTGNAWHKQQMYPVNLIAKGAHFIREVQYAKHRYAALQYRYAGPESAQCPPRLTAVLVIGESARAANWSLYGYGRDTNPQVAACFGKSAGRGVVFADALAAGRLTMHSVPSILSPATAREFQDYCAKPSLLRVFGEAGYRTAVLSSHVRASEFWDGSCALMKGDARESRHFDKDGDLPAALGEWLAQGDLPRQFAVLHLFGSHYDYADRYPRGFDRFSGGDPLVDTYDNSILFTDHVLACLIGELDRRREPAVLFYASDHGENLNDFGDGNLHHSCRGFTRYEIEVPMIFYANRAFADAYPGRMAAIRACASQPVGHDNLAHTLLGLAGLTDPQAYRPAYDLSKDPYVPQPRFLITSLRESVAEETIRATPQGGRGAVARPAPR